MIYLVQFCILNVLSRAFSRQDFCAFLYCTKIPEAPKDLRHARVSGITNADTLRESAY